MTTPNLPTISELWDFDDPVATRARFVELLDSAAVRAAPDFGAELRTQIARTHSLAGEFDEAHQRLDEVEPDLDARAPIVRVRYLLERGRTFNSSKAADEARPLFVEAWDLARQAGLDGLAVDAAHMLGIVEPPAQAIEWNERAMAHAEASDDPAARNWLGALYNNMGWTYHDEGDFERALELFEKGLQWRRERGHERPTRIAKWTVGRALRSLGRTDEALVIQTELEAAWGDDEPSRFVFEELAELYRLRGDEARANDYLAQAQELQKTE